MRYTVNIARCILLVCSSPDQLYPFSSGPLPPRLPNETARYSARHSLHFCIRKLPRILRMASNDTAQTRPKREFCVPKKHCKMRSRRTKQIQRSKGNLQCHRPRSDNVQRRVSKSVRGHAEAEAVHDVERATSQAVQIKSVTLHPSATTQPSASPKRSLHTLARVCYTAIGKVMAGDGSKVGSKEFPVNECLAESNWHNDITSFYHIDISSYRSLAQKNSVFSLHAETVAAKRNN